MRSLVALAAVVFALVAAEGVEAASDVSRGPVPGWVLPLAPRLEASSEGVDTSDGVHHLLDESYGDLRLLRRLSAAHQQCLVLGHHE